MSCLIKAISDDINLSVAEIKFLLNPSERRAKKIKIPKSNGNFRVVYHPNVKLKSVQYWLINKFFKLLPVSDFAFAFREKRSIVDNATVHCNSNYFMKFDFENFFPSLKFPHFVRECASVIYERYPQYSQNDIRKLVKFICFDRNQKLVQGFPTSPILSNAIMNRFDIALSKQLTDWTGRSDSFHLTRYADDIVISFDDLKIRSIIDDKFPRFIQGWNVPRLRINSSKTRFFNKKCGLAHVTGVRICRDGHLTTFKKTKSEIRLLLSLYRRNRLERGDFNTLLGLLSYIKMVDSHFYTKISSKFFKEIYDLKKATAI